MWNCLSVEADPEPRAISAGSLEDFITEHYWGFTKRRHGGTSQYEVRHPSWTVYPIRRHRVDIDFRTLYGPEFAGLSLLKPHSVLLAEGSPVSVATGSRLASG